MQHISPEEALEHIQALLEAKQDRVREGPNWPGAEQQAHPSGDPSDLQAGSPTQSGTGSDAQPEHTLSHQRGNRAKNGNS